MSKKQIEKYILNSSFSLYLRTPRSECKERNDVNEIIVNIGIIDNNSNINIFEYIPNFEI